MSSSSEQTLSFNRSLSKSNRAAWSYRHSGTAAFSWKDLAGRRYGIRWKFEQLIVFGWLSRKSEPPLWEADAAQQVLKASIRANSIKNRIRSEGDHQIVAILKTFLQPFKSTISFPSSHARSGRHSGIHISADCFQPTIRGFLAL
jgi:hypothetical protein